MQGRSWRPLLEGGKNEWRDSFFFEYFWEQQRGATTPSLTGVRTESAKLIRYKDHDEWTELFDLLKDPYELKNLYHEPSASSLRARLESEYARQRQAVGYVWPSYASDPSKFPDLVADQSAALNSWVLDYQFNEDKGDQVIDSSGKANHGHAHNVLLVAGRRGHSARRFDGSGYIEAPKSPSLNPAVSNWTIEVTFKAESDDAVVLAHGGGNFGYCLSLKDGQPLFTLVAARHQTQVAATDKVKGAWTTVRAEIGPETLSLSMDNHTAHLVPLSNRITRMPSEGLQVGDDLGTAVLGQSKPPPFKGLIESVRIYSGARKM
jgi:Domain of unknown function (DUF4976)/Concanavalin A-like lectin/glucanases superfamily